ncbi:MAG: hypothetical protein NVS4B12_06150 [Ktedonobacteraceae bacterium]
MSEDEKRWSERLQAMVHAGLFALQPRLGDPDGESFVLTPKEMRRLLDLLSQERSIISHSTQALVGESVHGPLDDLMASFASQRAYMKPAKKER